MTFKRGKDSEAVTRVVPFQRQLISPCRALGVVNKKGGFYAVLHENRSPAVRFSLLEVAEM